MTRLVEPLSYFARIIWVTGHLALGSSETRLSQPFGNFFRGRHRDSVPGRERTTSPEGRCPRSATEVRRRSHTGRPHLVFRS
jgi:hypothetical protein